MLPEFLKTDKKESRDTRIFRWGMGIFPVIFGTGVKNLFISADWHEVHSRLGLNMWTRNYVGTIYGGSFFSAADWQYMIMLSRILGKDFIVWDKAASIKFKCPGKERLYAQFLYTAEEVENIRQQATEKGEMTFPKPVLWKDKNGNVVAEIERTLYVATKSFYKAKLEARSK